MSARKYIVPTLVAVLAPIAGLFMTSEAQAARPPKAETCTSINMATQGSAEIGRKGFVPTDTTGVGITQDGDNLVFTPNENYTLTGVVLDGVASLVDPQVEAGNTASFPAPVWTKGKAKTVSACGFYTEPTNPNPQVFTVTASCGTYSQNEGYNWAFIWDVTPDPLVDRTTQVVATNLTTGEVDGRGERIWQAGTPGGSDVYVTNVGDEVVIDYLVDGVRVTSLSFSGVIAADTACSGVYPAP